MKVENNTWKIESISGTDLVMVTQKDYNDERIVKRRAVPDAATLRAMSELDFDRTARSAFLGWDVTEEKPERRWATRAAAGVSFCLALVVALAFILLRD